MDMPQPGPAQERLQRFVGRWAGPEVLAPSPWGPGGPATGRIDSRRALNGMALVQDSEEEKDGKVVFHGHGVMLVSPASEDELWWWFDSLG